MQPHLKEAIQSFVNANPARFHVPSHKGRGEGLVSRPYDVTELGFSDNLLEPKGPIARDLEEIAGIYGVKRTYLGVNGCTGLLSAATLSLLAPGKHAILGANSHLSAYYAILHAGGVVHRAPLKEDALGPGLEGYAQALAECPEADLAILTSPSYYGIGWQLEETISLFHSRNIPVIVDEAHGAHLRFAPPSYCPDAVSLGADMIIHSGYKTIAGPTQTAFLHINSDRADEEAVSAWLRTLMTTSPSYPLMVDAISAALRANECGKQLENIRLWYNETSTRLAATPLFLANDRANGPAPDCIKLPVSFENSSISGLEAARTLEGKWGIYAEMAGESLCLFYAGLGSVREDFERLWSALGSLGAKERPKRPAMALPPVQSAMPMRDAMAVKSRWLPIEDACGLVSAGFCGAYPPGSPVLIPGDIVSAQAADYLRRTAPQSLFGAKNGQIKVVAE